ncbi:MAG TPA: glutamate racemase [Candidatus Goldiibacteriota bacterium]|nr:glutamate racemase [Candidatus Goldiibacteriota bacterium]
MNNKAIGVFDSGLGGLTVVKEIMKILPDEKIIYLGDTARTPYGTKTKETIIRFSAENTAFLLKKNVKAVVVACNTASALALNEIKKEFGINIIGVIDAGARAAVAATENKRIGIIGTKATIGSGIYEKTIKKFNPDIKVFSNPAPLLVPLVEEGWLDRRETEGILKYYLAPFKGKKIDTLVLGCTHYPLLKPLIRRIMPDVNVIDSGKETAAVVSNLLIMKNQVAKKGNSKNSAFYVTDTPAAFNRVGAMFLKGRMIKAKKITL